jgi:hypothetical protein
MKKSDYEFEKQLIIESLKSIDEGDLITFSELSALAGLDIQFGQNHILQSALSFVLEEHGLVFKNIRNTGYIRLTPAQIVEDTRSQTRIRSACELGSKRLVSADYDRLTDGEKRRHQSKLASMAFVKLVSTEKSIAMLESKMKDMRESTLESRKYLEALLECDL